MERPRFLNSASIDAPLLAVSASRKRGSVRLRVRFGLWHHPTAGTVLVDTGYGPRATTDPGRSFPLRLYSMAIKPKLTHPHGAIGMLHALGIDPHAIRFVFLTHFHADHISSLADFPNAKVICSSRSLSALRQMSRLRQLLHGFFSELLPADIDNRIIDIDDIPRVSLHPDLTGVDIFSDGSCYAVDMPGHALGHTGVFWPNAVKPLLYAVDAAWLEEDMTSGPRHPLLERVISPSKRDSLSTRRFLATLRGDGVQVVLCHEPNAHAGLED